MALEEKNSCFGGEDLKFTITTSQSDLMFSSGQCLFNFIPALKSKGSKCFLVSGRHCGYRALEGSWDYKRGGWSLFKEPGAWLFGGSCLGVSRAPSRPSRARTGDQAGALSLGSFTSLHQCPGRRKLRRS